MRRHYYITAGIYLTLTLGLCCCSKSKRLTENEIKSILDLAQKYKDNSNYKAALKEYIALSERCISEYHGAGLTFVLSDIIELSKKYPKARQYVLKRRNKIEKNIIKGEGQYYDIGDYVLINKLLNEENKNIEILHKIVNDEKLLKTREYLLDNILPDIIKKKNYNDIIFAVPSIIETMESKLILYSKMKNDRDKIPDSKDLFLFLNKETYKKLLDAYEILLVLGKEEGAVNLFEKILLYEKTVEIYKGFIDRSVKINRNDLALKIIKDVKEQFDKSEIGEIMLLEKQIKINNISK